MYENDKFIYNIYNETIHIFLFTVVCTPEENIVNIKVEVQDLINIFIFLFLIHFTFRSALLYLHFSAFLHAFQSFVLYSVRQIIVCFCVFFSLIWPLYRLATVSTVHFQFMASDYPFGIVQKKPCLCLAPVMTYQLLQTLLYLAVLIGLWLSIITFTFLCKKSPYVKYNHLTGGTPGLVQVSGNT